MKHPIMTTADREKLVEAYKVAIQDIERTSLAGENDSPTMVARKDRATAARAALLAAMEPVQGEVYEATMRMGYNGHGPAFFYPVFDRIVPLKPGDRVRVSKVEVL